MPDDPSCQAPHAPTGAVPRTCVPFAHVPAVPVVAVPYVPVPVPSGLPVLSVSGILPDRTGNVDVSQFLSSWAAEFAAAKADKAPPATEGNLAALTADGNLADSGATPASIKTAAVAEVVANAPGTMDTLKEIADILGSVQQSGTVLKRISDLESGKRGADDLSYAPGDWFVTGAAEMRLVRDGSVQPQMRWSATVAGETWVLLYNGVFWRFGVRGATAEDEGSGADATSLTFDIDGNIYNLSKGSRLALINDVPQADSSSTPQMDSASGSAGGAQTTTYSKSDHSHPSDTSKQDALSKSQLAAVNSGVTSARVEKWDGYAAQIAEKADAADIPYRLVEPGKWAFSGSGYDPDNHTYEVAIEKHSDEEYEYQLYVDGGGPVDYSNGVTPDLLTVVFGLEHITATRASLPSHLCDRAGNRVEVSGDTTLTLPAVVPGYLRDFLVRLEISGSTVPTITFAASGNESLTYETDGDEFPVPDEAGTWLYSFTETAASTFAVSLKKVNVVAQGGS